MTEPTPAERLLVDRDLLGQIHEALGKACRSHSEPPIYFAELEARLEFALGMCEPMDLTAPAPVEPPTPPVVAESELPDGPGVWFRDGEAWLAHRDFDEDPWLWVHRIETSGHLSITMKINPRGTTDSRIPRGHWSRQPQQPKGEE